MKFNFESDQSRSRHIISALDEMGFATAHPDGAKICFDEELMPKYPGWLTPRQSLLWTRKHLYYKKLKIPFHTVRNVGQFMAVPYPVFWIKPSASHWFEKKIRRWIVEDKAKFIMQYGRVLEEDVFVCMEPIRSNEQVWVMTLWDSMGRHSNLWYSTEKIHATSHPMKEVLDYAVSDIGKKLGIKKWMTFMEFCVFGQSAEFIDLNPRLPGDDDWHEHVYLHLCGRSLGLDIANLFAYDRLPPRIMSENVVLEGEWDGGGILPNQMAWPNSDGYKKKPLLTFVKK